MSAAHAFRDTRFGVWCDVARECERLGAKERASVCEVDESDDESAFDDVSSGESAGVGGKD